MKNSPLVSIIIPIYNVEAYLEKCLDSVIGQTYDNIEVILVNDNSPDKSGEIAELYSDKDKRIRVVHKKVNEGLNYARRDGFKKSKGRYVTFLDSDDLLHEEAISTYIQALLEHDADIAVAGFFDFNDGETPVSTPLNQDAHEVHILQTKDEIVKYALLGEPKFPDANYMTACGKIYKRELIDHVEWRKSNFKSYEDNFWTPQVLMMAERIVLVSSKLYLYRRSVTYASGGTSLGNRMVGNVYNGKPVGYLEYLELLHDFHIELTKRYGINMQDDLEVVHYQWSWNRLFSLIDAEMLDSENNLQYVKDIWLKHQREDWKLQQQKVELIERIQKCEDQRTSLEEEVKSLYGIRRSAWRLLGNIKRKIF